MKTEEFCKKLSIEGAEDFKMSLPIGKIDKFQKFRFRLMYDDIFCIH